MRSISTKGCYDPRYEHDNCGVGFVVNIDGTRSHTIICQGIQILENLVHRGAAGCDPDTGDGAGMLVQIPHQFFAREAGALGFDLPEPGAYAAGMVFLPQDAEDRAACMAVFEKTVEDQEQTFLGWRAGPRLSAGLRAKTNR